MQEPASLPMRRQWSRSGRMADTRLIERWLPTTALGNEGALETVCPADAGIPSALVAPAISTPSFPRKHVPAEPASGSSGGMTGFLGTR